jgi:sterol desaturase/sphingolipid hydroxylase (fatty acid hydroxylase superfamily)
LSQILSYVLHRYVLHSKNSKNFLAKYHQSWYHALRAPFPLTAHYDHPLTYIIYTFIPTYLPAMLFRFHMLTYLLYLSIISIEETFVYSGYTIMPTSFFLGGIARRTDMHLLLGAEGNFGPWGILDWIFGTTVGDTDVEDDIMDELEEHEIEDKMRRAVQSSKRKIKAGTSGRRRRRDE